MSEEEGTSLSVWIGLVVISLLSFYSQAAVTEERFVPALNVIASEFNIPDDVAGATLMAAGASSPELFSSIVALFVTHSALGLGVSLLAGARDVFLLEAADPLTLSVPLLPDYCWFGNIQPARHLCRSRLCLQIRLSAARTNSGDARDLLLCTKYRPFIVCPARH